MHTSQLLHTLFYVPRAKLVFCGVPKNGITEWMKLFRMFMGAGDYQSLPHYKRDLEPFKFSQLDPGKGYELLTSPEWTRAVMFRDPAERILSAYLNKIALYAKHIRRGAVPDTWRNPDKFEKAGISGKMTFREFVLNITAESGCPPNGPRQSVSCGRCADPHWRPQVYSCGLDVFLPEYNLVGSMAHLANHSRTILEDVGMWDAARHYSYQTGGGAMCATKAPVAGTATEGFNQNRVDFHGHSTNSGAKVDKYYTADLMAIVRKAYAVDFAIWDHLAKSDRVVSGGEVVQAACKAGVDRST